MRQFVAFSFVAAYPSSCLKYGTEKSQSRKTCLDLELRNEKPVRQPVFLKTGYRDKIQSFKTNLLQRRCEQVLIFSDL